MAISYFDDKAKKVVQTDKKGITKGPKPPPKVNPVSYLTGQFMQQQPPSHAPQAVGYWDAKPPKQPEQPAATRDIPWWMKQWILGVAGQEHNRQQQANAAAQPFQMDNSGAQVPINLGYTPGMLGAGAGGAPLVYEDMVSDMVGSSLKGYGKQTYGVFDGIQPKPGTASTVNQYPTWEEWGMRAWQSFFKRRSKPNYDLSAVESLPQSTSGYGTGYGTGGGYGDRPDIKNWWQQLVYWRI